MATGLFTTPGISKPRPSRGSTCNWPDHLENTPDPLKSRAATPRYPLSLREPLHLQTLVLPAPLCVSPSGLAHTMAPLPSGTAFPCSSPVNQMLPPWDPWSFSWPMPDMASDLSMLYASVYSVSGYMLVCFQPQATEILSSMGFSHSEMVGYILASPPWGPIFGLLSPEALALFFWDSVDFVLLYMLASCLLLQKDGSRINSGSRSLNSPRSLQKASHGSDLSGMPGLKATNHQHQGRINP